jgi:hypothetical protein
LEDIEADRQATDDPEYAPGPAITVLYFGDHDPDGFGIPRAAPEGLEKLMVLQGAKAAYGWDAEDDGNVHEFLADRAAEEGTPDDFPEDLRDWLARTPRVQFHRVALTMEQIRQYSPPPFPAKETSARYARYVNEQHTTDAWELDALEPRVLRSLITSEIDKRFDRAVWRRMQEPVAAVRQEFADRLDAVWLEQVRRGLR